MGGGWVGGWVATGRGGWWVVEVRDHNLPHGPSVHHDILQANSSPHMIPLTTPRPTSPHDRAAARA